VPALTAATGPAPAPLDREAPGARETVLAALALAATMTIAFLLVPHGYAYEHTWEYERMIAGQPAAAPFAHRLLVPWLLSLAPLPPRASFLVSTLAATLATLIALYLLCRARGIAPRPALVAAQLAAFSYPIALYLGFWGMVDPVASLFTVLILLGMVRDRVALVGVSLLLGTFTKETTAVFAPAVAWWLWRRPGGTAMPVTAAVLAALPIALYFAVRASVPTVPGRWDLRGWDDLVRFWTTLWAMKSAEGGPAVWLAGVVVRAYGFFWVTAALGLGDPRAWRGMLAWLLLASLALCAVATDWARMLGLAFPAVFLATAAFLDRIERRPRALTWFVALLALAAAQCWTTLAPFGTMGPVLARWHVPLTIACVLGGSAVALVAWRAGSSGVVPHAAST
jgi:hypothetical protein